MKISGISADYAQIFWITSADNKWNDQKCCDFPIVTDGQWHTYNINMSPFPAWKERLSAFRVDPIASGNYGKVEIARIALTEAPLPPEQPEQAKQPVPQPAVATGKGRIETTTRPFRSLNKPGSPIRIDQQVTDCNQVYLRNGVDCRIQAVGSMRTTANKTNPDVRLIHIISPGKPLELRKKEGLCTTLV